VRVVAAHEGCVRVRRIGGSHVEHIPFEPDRHEELQAVAETKLRRNDQGMNWAVAVLCVSVSLLFLAVAYRVAFN